jgi:hypothetical protein
LKIETIRFVARDEDEAYFIRAVLQLATGCVLMNAEDDVLTALVDVVTKAVGARQRAKAAGTPAPQ